MLKMNSMNKLVEEIKSKFEILNSSFPDSSQIILAVNNNEVHSILSYLKTLEFRQLSMISCVDWIKENKFELVYILMNWKTGVHILLSTKLDRENPVFRTITNIYPGAQYYARDIHEFFGVEFEGLSLIHI